MLNENCILISSFDFNELKSCLMKTPVYNQEGKEVGSTILPKEMFEVPLNIDLVHQVVVSQAANKRQVTAQTKDRGEVRGGGRKPWRQKGTGRARHGSRRSPLWVGGGVTFGPTKERVFKKKINQRVKRTALFMVLSAKARDKMLVVLDKLSLPQPKTKLMKNILEALPTKDASCLITLSKPEKDIVRAAKNLPQTATIEARNLNVLDLVSFKYLVLPKDTIKVIKETFS